MERGQLCHVSRFYSSFHASKTHPNHVNRSYIAIPVFFALWLGYKITLRTKQLKPTEVDLATGLRRIDEEEKVFLAAEAAKGPRTRLQKIWDSL